MKKTIKFHVVAVMNGKEIELEDAVNGVAKENLKLNKRIEELEVNLNTIMIERNNFLSKIDKAIEYIKQGDWHENDAYLGNDILSILRGEE